MLSTLESGDHLIALKLDRLFRSASDALNVAAQLRERGIHLHLLDIGGEVTGNGAAKLVFSVLAAVAEMERERIGERVRGVKQHLRENGYYSGGVIPSGFKLNKSSRKLEPIADWERVVTAMKDMRDSNQTYRQIATRSKDELGVSMDHSTVFRILNGKRAFDPRVCG